MRLFILKLPALVQLLFIVFSTVLVAFGSAITVYFLFGSLDLTPKSGLITAIYAVLGTIYAVLVAFSISGVWQNYCASEMSVTTEVDALIDLIHTVGTSTQDNGALIRETAIEYLNEAVTVEWPALAKGHSHLILSPKSNSCIIAFRLINAIKTIQPRNERQYIIFSHALTLLSKWLDARRARIMISKGNIAKSLWPMLIVGAFILFAFHGMFTVENHFLWSTLLLFFSGIIGLSFYIIFTFDCPFGGSPSVDSDPFNWAIIWLKNENFL